MRVKLNFLSLVLLAILLLFLSLFLSSFLTSCSFSGLEGEAVVSLVKDEGNISVYFCPRDDCEKALVSFIDSAEKYVHCALFDIGLKSVQEVLDRKSKEIEVEVITDNNYIHKFNRSFVKADKWGLMHNKFCVVDGIKISTGSMNPTENGAFRNNNNLVLIESRVLAGNYLDEFEEMWEGEFKKGEKVLNPKVEVNGTQIESYFCPEDNCAERVKEELRKAKKSIYFMTFSFTHDGIANVILLKNLEGVGVKGVIEARQVSKYSKFKVLEYQIGSDMIMKDGNKANMHHKVFIIDDAVVVTGSFNPTSSGDSRNDENVLVIHSEEIAKLFLEEFERVWEEAER